MDELPEQLDEIRERLELEPCNAELHQALGKALLKSGELVEARFAYENAIVLDPTDPFSYLYLGNLEYTESNYIEALKQFRKAQELSPELAIVYVCMADIYHRLGEIELADMNYHKAVEVEPDDDTAQNNLERWNRIKKA